MPPRPSRRQTAAARLLIATILGAGLIGLAGCYERVVGARGLGADQYTVSEPYQSDSAVDRWLFGEQRSSGPSRRLSPPAE
jgi:hypothetical protein